MKRIGGEIRRRRKENAGRTAMEGCMVIFISFLATTLR
jgi:hypothetical protein